MNKNIDKLISAIVSNDKKAVQSSFNAVMNEKTAAADIAASAAKKPANAPRKNT
jgi:hypothetical protein